jgi:N6-L-threonylcarbamoyladenine synthase
MRIVGIETSCDETAIGVVEDGRGVLSNVVASSLEFHAPYGGVIPEIAARLHVETIWDVFTQALAEARLAPEAIDAVAVTRGPGLPGALLIGLAFAKGLALALERPLIPVDHLAAHLYAGEMTDGALEPPYVGLVVSGGHTLLCVAHADCRYEVLGETRDDAVGEAFDKVAKLLGLGYPGGPVIDRLSEQGRVGSVMLPRAHTKQAFDFSFSGLKTAVVHHVGKLAEGFQPQQVADVAAGFQEAAVEVLVTKTLKACQRTGMKRVVVGGGVASNRRLRTRFGEAAAEHKLQVVFPPPTLCVDNGAMVAGIAFPLLQRGRIAPLSVASDPNLCLNG